MTEHHPEHDDPDHGPFGLGVDQPGHDDLAPEETSQLDPTDDTVTQDRTPDEVPAPPETGDIVIDAALRDLAAASADDLDTQLASGEAVHRTLQSRLSDLGG